MEAALFAAHGRRRIAPAGGAGGSADEYGLAALRARIDAVVGARELEAVAASLPQVVVSLVRAGVPAPDVTRAYTAIADAVTSRLIALSVARRGAPPVAFAWLDFGSAARYELSLSSDQDNGLAYQDPEDPAVDVYFSRLAADVNEGLCCCGFPLDCHEVLAGNKDWRRPVSEWVSLLRDCEGGWDNERLMRAAVGFDVRQVAGDLAAGPRFEEVVREAKRHSRFLGGLAGLGAEIPSPLRFRGRLKGCVDVKRRGLLPVQNLARYYACSAGLTALSTLDRLEAVREAGGRGSDVAGPLAQAFVTMLDVQLRHELAAVECGERLGRLLDTAGLDPDARDALRAAFRVVAAVQVGLPRRTSF